MRAAGSPPLLNCNLDDPHPPLVDSQVQHLRKNIASGNRMFWIPRDGAGRRAGRCGSSWFHSEDLNVSIPSLSLGAAIVDHPYRAVVAAISLRALDFWGVIRSKPGVCSHVFFEVSVAANVNAAVNN
ncbi:hypothetical protein ONZ45_g4482 [Pleurotus djamor]|nr:hypothetical protein ONZ45_g4482 [Pleurotus djamor]